MKALIQSVFDSMKRDERLAQTETNSSRSKFYSMTKQPIKLESKILESKIIELQVKTALMKTIRRLVEFASGWSSVSDSDVTIEVTSTTPTIMVKARGKYTLQWSYEGARKGLEKHVVEFETKRAVKLSTFLLKHVQEPKVEWFKNLPNIEGALTEFIQRDEGRKHRWVSSRVEEFNNYVQSELKSLTNMLKSEDECCWLYFTTTNIPKHYIEMRASQNLSSCMSKNAGYFGSSFGGSYRHPLMGYEYAPDYRLGLISRKSPEEIKSSTEYPFILRVMVFPYKDSDMGMAYARYYGDESVGTLLEKHLPCVKKVKGLELFGMVSDELNPSDIDSATDELMNEYRSENVEYHLVAPFIDGWNNCLHFAEDGEIITREDGKSVVRLVTGCLARNRSEEGWGDEYLSIYHGSGVLQIAVKDRDETWNLYYKDGAWNDC